MDIRNQDVPDLNANKKEARFSGRDAKIIGRGYRPAPKTPKTFPYTLTEDKGKRKLALHWSDEHNSYYIGDSRYNKTKTPQGEIRNLKRRYIAFVKLHPSGLILHQYGDVQEIATFNFIKRVDK